MGTDELAGVFKKNIHPISRAARISRDSFKPPLLNLKTEMKE